MYLELKKTLLEPESFFKLWYELDPFQVRNSKNEEEPTRWIENPEWKKKQIDNKINHNNSLIGIYEENIVRCKNEIKELEKELNEKTPK